jgi:hypothetical protein
MNIHRRESVRENRLPVQCKYYINLGTRGSGCYT